MKKTLIALAIILIVAIAGFLIWNWSTRTEVAPGDNMEGDSMMDDSGNTEDPDEQSTEEETDRSQTVLGTSVAGHPINAYHFGEGETELLFVGGIHGGYSWNTVLVAEELVDHLRANPDAVPENVRVTVVPILNPDGLDLVTGSVTGNFTVADVATSQATLVSGRFNGNNVDLNRNFDCEWQASGTWQNRTVSGGSAAFSEPESAAIRDYVNANRPDAVVTWYSAAGGVYASNCRNGILPETRAIMNAYATASGYPAYENFDFYAITGDMTNWLAKNNIPAISILLTNHQDVEWNKNRAGVEALLDRYAE